MKVSAGELELYTNRFASIAREMGEMLRRTALSTNVKERLDFSCALLDADGELVVNAPHIPVHLGALGLCVRAVRKVLPLGSGDVAVTNHPAFGGSHLPDVTVITPVYTSESLTSENGALLLGYVASRAHHAEIGGIRPGSMPPAAGSLAEEGVVLPPTLLFEGGKPRWDKLGDLLMAPPFPSRALEENLADLAAAVAANRYGVRALQSLAADAPLRDGSRASSRGGGAETVLSSMKALREQARTLMVEALEEWSGKECHAREELDDGTPLEVKISFPPGRAIVDFSGSGGTHKGNLNAPPAVLRSAVLYVLRLLLNRPLPLNEGLLSPVEIRAPKGILNPPFDPDPKKCPAVVGGNVETSQRIVEVLLKALGLVAGSQGTMNNLLFGDGGLGYYETICGGCGAGPTFDGASAVHSHMTNTRITDPEVLEHRYPVRLEEFSIRRGSGGAGRYRGGAGVVRELIFSSSLSLSILSQHRREGPYGANGGWAGAPGHQTLYRASGGEEELPAMAACEVEKGDRLRLETPGGGGWGEPDSFEEIQR